MYKVSQKHCSGKMSGIMTSCYFILPEWTSQQRDEGIQTKLASGELTVPRLGRTGPAKF